MNIAQIDNLLEEKLVYSEFLSATNRQKMCEIIFNYCTNKRVSMTILSYRLEETIIFLQELDLTLEEITSAIKNSPSLLHANKKDMLSKYLVLVYLDEHLNQPIRKQRLIENTKYYVIGLSTIYARIMYLQEHNPNEISKWHVLKMTNKEFETKFNVNTDQLKLDYPFDDQAFMHVLDHPDNEEIKNKIFVSSRSGGYHA